MKAYRLVAWRQPPELAEVPVPEPGPGQVLVRVGGSGACHSDLHIMDFPALPWTLPFTLGHETAGWVQRVGDGVAEFGPGDPVAVYGPWGCGSCRRCRLGMENYCERVVRGEPGGGGLGLDGGMAEYLLVPSSRLLVPLGELDPAQAAPLGDAALTPYHAIKRSRGMLIPGSTALVIGVGGLGHMAVQILRATCPARIVATDVDDHKLSLARELGADETVRAETAEERIREVTEGAGAELVLDFVGSDQTLALAARSVRAMGHLTVVGLAMGTLGFNYSSVPNEASVATTYWGSVTELMEVIALAAAGKIAVQVERFPLDDTAEAYERLRAGTLRGRAVIVP